MKHIGIAELKKQAKLLRKNNNTIKNHSESLDFIANQYDFKRWDDLINHSSLILENHEDDDANNIFKNILSSNMIILNDFQEAFETDNYTYIYQTFYSVLFRDESNMNGDFWLCKGQIYLEFACYMYSLKKDKKISDFKDILVADKFMNMLKAVFSEEDIKNKNNIMFRRFAQHSFYGFAPFKDGDKQILDDESFTTFQEQMGFAVLGCYQNFDKLVKLLDLFMGLSESEIIESLKVKENAQSFFYNPVIEKSDLALYQQSLLGREVPFFNTSFFDKHLDFINGLS